MFNIARFTHTCLAVAAALASGTSTAAGTADTNTPGAVAQTMISRLIAKAQALPLSLMPASQASQASGHNAAPSVWTGAQRGEAWTPQAHVQPQPLAREAEAAPSLAPAAQPSSSTASTDDMVAVAQPTPRKIPTEEVQDAGGQWELDPTDGSVKRALQRWCKASGWQLVWELPVDFPVVARASFVGGFEQSVTAIAVSMQNSQMPIKAVFYRGNKVLRIVAKGAQ